MYFNADIGKNIAFVISYFFVQQNSNRVYIYIDNNADSNRHKTDSIKLYFLFVFCQ